MNTIHTLLDRHMPHESDTLGEQGLHEFQNGKTEQVLVLRQRTRQNGPSKDEAVDK